VARLRLGQVTDTQDISGTVLEEHPVTVGEEELRAVLPAFTGDIQQLPPMYSAISVNGKRLYDLARKGVEVERASREIVIEELELLEGGQGLGDHEYDLRARCSKGTYVRTICHDIGAALGCGGTMAALRRIKSGRFTLENALTFEEIAALLAENALESRLFPTDSVFFDLPEVHLNAEGDVRASPGNFFAERHLASGDIPAEGQRCRVYDSAGRFCQIGETRQLDKGGLAIFCKINFGNKE
jgi:tRNA pseudouridine55 synthase